MRIQLIFVLLLFPTLSHAMSDAAINELFKKYDMVMDDKKVELVEEVFSQKFLKQNGGTKGLVSNIQSMTTEKSNQKVSINWRKSSSTDTYIATITPVDKKALTPPEFLIIKENDKLKIDGTIGNDE